MDNENSRKGVRLEAAVRVNRTFRLWRCHVNRSSHKSTGVLTTNTSIVFVPIGRVQDVISGSSHHSSRSRNSGQGTLPAGFPLLSSCLCSIGKSLFLLRQGVELAASDRLVPLLSGSEALETLCFIRQLSVRTYCLHGGHHAYLKVRSCGSDTWFVVGAWWCRSDENGKL